MRKNILSKAVSLSIGLCLAHHGMAQDGLSDPSAEIIEIVTVGKLRSAADDVLVERQDSPVVADYLDNSTITRVGDATAASALRRVPGVTLVDDKFVYIRGLGERYSTSLLNGAQIPSPDLTRNVIPLDIFPTSVIRSLAVQKGYSADMPANFSGGLVDIRTVTIPDEFLFRAEIGSSYNSETRSDVLSYNGGSDDKWGTDDGTRAMSPLLQNALDQYGGDLGPLTIYNDLVNQGLNPAYSDAQLINRQLATELNRDIDVVAEDRDPDIGLELNVGNSYYFDNGMELGFIAAGAYNNTWRSRERISRSFGDPDNIFQDRQETVHNVNLTGNLGLGWRWWDDHSISTTSLLLRNTDDTAFIVDYFDSSFPYSNGRGFRGYGVRYEGREMLVNQINGSHRFGGVTKDLLGIDGLDWADDLTLTWFYSDSESTTEIPNESTTTYRTTVDTASGDVLSRRLQTSVSAGDFRFTDLDDDVVNWGWDVELPLYLRSMDVVLRGGWNVAEKKRVYKQLQYSLGTSNNAVADSLTGLTSQVFSDPVIVDSANDMIFNVFGSNGESYQAAISNTAGYGEVDITWNETWRIVAGLRWEDYAQVGIEWDPLEYTGCQITCDSDELLDATFKEDDFYPSIAVTYMNPYFWDSNYQLRLGYSETLVRPDLREITSSSYIDPITGAIVKGNSNVTPSTVKNYDLRNDWFFNNGDSLSASIFYKDIQDPIDFFEAAAFEEALAAEIINAESAEILGLEIEWLKNLEFLGGNMDLFFVSGNLTVLETELVAGPNADAPTNQKRDLAGASDAFNLQVGYDSPYGAHSMMLIYNVFGERLYLAGRLGTPDAYEQPFHSLDFTYFWYPTDNLTLRFVAKNLLDESTTIEQGGTLTFEEKPGTSVSLDVRWSY